ncbi:MAG: GntR family transcriptional regulator [Clostridia bacterium]|nr:GntR family transcriptional regulator [Clostridia bacterium]MDD4146147.1 GntR family transcriptional regulator [Clostridia bacterium]MDD4665812.1 GntR family transcriptional regulator [Clostridia bacterium]
MFQLDLRESKPLYEQIKEKMKELIISAVLKPDERIPSVRELAQTLTINPNTIQKAYKELENEGFIYSVRAKGNFVAPLEQKAIRPRRDELRKELEKIVAELSYLHEPEEQLISTIQAIYQEKEGKKDD